jgi:hypothetical protein
MLLLLVCIFVCFLFPLRYSAWIVTEFGVNIMPLEDIKQRVVLQLWGWVRI